jgi:DNA (cytosine-5)-methyltransferase 1
MNELALFTGAGGGLLASHVLGHNIVCAVERDEYCIEVLVQRQNERTIQPFPIWDDICTFNGLPWNGTVDLVSGGFPCQAFSSAARGRNVAEKNLWKEMFRVIREVNPRAVFAENVSEKAILQAESDLCSIGYSCKHIELSAKDVGADHQRNRFWLLAYTNDYSKLLCTKYAKAQKLQELRNSVWETFPNEFRVSDGVAFGMDRLKALGNGQVPIVAASAWLELNRQVRDSLVASNSKDFT